MVKFGKPPVIRQIYYGFPPPTTYAIRYVCVITIVAINDDYTWHITRSAWFLDISIITCFLTQIAYPPHHAL